MIRFIDLKGQIYLDETERSFAFFDTVSDKFCDFSGCQCWDSVNEFRDDYIGDNIQRFLNLIPDEFNFDYEQITRDLLSNSNPQLLSEITDRFNKSVKFTTEYGGNSEKQKPAN